VRAVTGEPEQNSPEGRRLVVVVGGTGFLGRRVVRHLLDRGVTVRAAVRHPERIQRLFAARLAGLQTVAADIADEGSLAAALAGAHGVVNAVSLYAECGRATFQAVHVGGAARLAEQARAAGLERLIHLSGIGADPASASPYIRARGEGERAVRQAFPQAVIVRPAVMFGSDDAFLTTLVRLLRRLPLQPLFGHGESRLQPVYVEDVAEAIARLLEGPGEAESTCYEFGGPRVYTYRELLEAVAREIGLHPRMVPVPFALWETLARAAEVVPGAGLTRHQIALMRTDTTASAKLPGLPELGVIPTPLEEIVHVIAGRSA
jgi:uncharacterized protein YbjT (DUF2867 family)